MIHTVPLQAKRSGEPEAALSYLVENLFGFEVENFVDVLVQLNAGLQDEEAGVDKKARLQLYKQTGDPPLEASDATTFKAAFGAVRLAPPEKGRGTGGGRKKRGKRERCTIA